MTLLLQLDDDDSDAGELPVHPDSDPVDKKRWLEEYKASDQYKPVTKSNNKNSNSQPKQSNNNSNSQPKQSNNNNNFNSQPKQSNSQNNSNSFPIRQLANCLSNCYVNSNLQNMVRHEPWIPQFMNQKNLKDKYGQWMKQIFYIVLNLSKEIGDITHILSNFEFVKLGQHQDAQENYRQLLDVCHNAVKRKHNEPIPNDEYDLTQNDEEKIDEWINRCVKNYFIKLDDSFIYDFKKFYFCSTFTCFSCNNHVNLCNQEILLPIQLFDRSKIALYYCINDKHNPNYGKIQIKYVKTQHLSQTWNIFLQNWMRDCNGFNYNYNFGGWWTVSPRFYVYKQYQSIMKTTLKIDITSRKTLVINNKQYNFSVFDDFNNVSLTNAAMNTQHLIIFTPTISDYNYYSINSYVSGIQSNSNQYHPLWFPRIISCNTFNKLTQEIVSTMKGDYFHVTHYTYDLQNNTLNEIKTHSNNIPDKINVYSIVNCQFGDGRVFSPIECEENKEFKWTSTIFDNSNEILTMKQCSCTNSNQLFQSTRKLYDLPDLLIIGINRYGINVLTCQIFKTLT